MAQFNSLLVTGNSRFLNPINGNARNGIYYVKGTQTAATGSWTGNIPTPALYDGLTIMYYLPYAGSGNATLNLTLSDGTTTGAKNCYYNGWDRLTTHYNAGQNVVMTYHPAGSISVNGTATSDDRWVVTADYNSDYILPYTWTGGGTAEKYISGGYLYADLGKQWFMFNLIYANTYAGALKLNVNGNGAKPLYINGTVSSSSNYTMPRGTYLTYYDGTNYYVRTDGKITAGITGDAATVGGHTVAKDVPSNADFSNTTYTFANGTNGFTVTPSGGSAQTVTVTPSITNNVTGSGTSGYIAKFNGSNTITNGPAIGSGTTKYLREDGTWQTPPSSSGTTYTIGTSGNNITLTPSSGSVQSITAPYATSAGSAASATSATSATTASKLGSSNVGSATNPIYLNGGTATACTYSLHKTVPSDAVFTDTTYSSLPAASGGTSLSLVTTGEKYTWNNKSLGDLSNVVVTNPDGGDILQYSYAEGNWVNGKITDMWVDGIYPVGAVFHVDTRTIPTGSHITLSQLNYSNLLGAPSNLPGESGGTDVSLVTTGEKYTWNNGCTDTKVTQTADTTNAYFPILLAGTADTTTKTEGTKKSGDLVFNPNSKELHVQGDVTVSGNISCDHINLEDISDLYTPSKTSGNWSIGSDDGAYRIYACRMGSLIQISIAFHGNGSAVSSGSNGFVGDISGGPLPVQQVTLTGFYSSSILAATLDTDGSLTVRPFSASCTLSNASRAYVTGMFLTNT